MKPESIVTSSEPLIVANRRRGIVVASILATLLWSQVLTAAPQAIRGTVRLEGRPLPGALVSDGFRVVSSDEQGDYRIDLVPEEPPPGDVFVVRPAGTRSVGRFWKVVPPEAEGLFGANFDFARDERSSHDDFSFVVVSDLHLRAGPMSGLGRVRPAPAFVACLGDLVNNEPDGMGNPGPLIGYGDLIRQHVWVPVFTAFGNHDWAKAPEGSEDQSLTYRRHIAPRRYAFECGTRLFVVYDTEIPRLAGEAADQAQRSWVEAVVAQSQSTGPIIVLQHIPPGEAQIKWLKTLGRPVQAIFSGHWHSNYLKRHDGMLDVNTPPLHLGGIDYSPAGFRVVRVEGDQMRMALHPLHMNKRLRIVAPSGLVTATDGAIEVVVTAFDAYVPVTGVRARLEGGGESVKLAPSGRWTWRGRIPVPDDLVKGTVQVTVADTEGDAWPQGTSSFDVLAEPGGFEPATPWPQFRRDAMGRSATPDLVRPPLRLAWTWSSGGEFDFGSPVTDGQRVYIGVRDDDDKGTQGIVALDAATGDFIWRFKTEESVRHTVSVANGRVFGVGFNGQVVALAACDGSVVWEQRLPLERGAFYSGIVTDGGRLFLRSQSRAFALASETGHILWSTDVGGGWNQSYATPAVHGDRVFIGTTVLDARSGSLLHEGASSVISPTVTDHGLALGSEMFDLQTLEPIWAAPINGRRWSSASTALAADRIYTVGSDSGHKKPGGLYGFSARNGEVAWMRGFGRGLLWRDGYRYYDGGSGSSTPAISAERVLYVGADDGLLRALNLEDGELLWQYDLGAPVASSPAVCGNAVFVAALDGNVYAFRASLDSHGPLSD